MQGQSPCPPAAAGGTLLCLFERRRGCKGEPSPGVLPSCFRLLRVRRYVGRWSLACPAFRPHFFGACPKKRCRATKEKRFFLPWRLHHPRERCCLGGRDVPRPTWGGAGAGRGLGALRVPFAGGERDRLWPLCAVGQLSGCHCRFSLPPTAKSAFLWGSTPFLCARAKKWGGFARPARSTTQ